MSEDLPPGIRFCPAVGTFKRTPEELIAEGHLGIELCPGGLWSRPIPAAAYWRWLRDEQPAPSRSLDELLTWLMRFLGLVERPTEAPRFFGLGFVQGAETALAHQPLPDGVLDPVPDALVNFGKAQVPTLGLATGTAALTRLRNWAKQWLTTDFMETPGMVWRLGLSMGHEATRAHPLVCGMLTAEIAAARFEQRFAGRALVISEARKPEAPWQAFIRSTYGHGIEGAVLAASHAESLDRARCHQGSLRSFLIDARTCGWSFARTKSPGVDALLREIGHDAIGSLRRFYVANSGPLTSCAPPDPLLEALRQWLFRTHPGLFGANDPGAEHVALRHAYDFLWWRGFLEGTP